MSERAKNIQLKFLGVAQLYTFATALCSITLMIGVAVVHKIWSPSSECSVRVMYGMFFTTGVIEIYMLFQECCTRHAIDKGSERYGCHNMSTHQFFMHCVAFGAMLSGTIVSANAIPNNKLWIIAIAASSNAMLGMNCMMRLIIVYYHRERAHYELEKLKAAALEA